MCYIIFVIFEPDLRLYMAGAAPAYTVSNTASASLICSGFAGYLGNPPSK